MKASAYRRALFAIQHRVACMTTTSAAVSAIVPARVLLPQRRPQAIILMRAVAVAMLSWSARKCGSECTVVKYLHPCFFPIFADVLQLLRYHAVGPVHQRHQHRRLWLHQHRQSR